MATFLDYNMLKLKSEEYIDSETGIDELPKAFPILMLANILSLEDSDAQDAITDGSDDRGADAVYIDERDGRNIAHIFQFKYAMTFEKSKSNFPSGEIDKLATLVDEILDKDTNLEKTCNAILWDKIKELWTAMEKPKFEVQIHFCSNTKTLTNDHQIRAESRFSKYKFKTVHHGLDNVATLFVDKKRPKVDRSIRLVDLDYFSRDDGNVRGLICSVEVKDLVEMITDEENEKEINTNIFNDNVRIYLKKTNKINRKIIETALSDTNSLFWYLNNGITVTCDSFSYQPKERSPIVELTNIQIVNGGQTSNALFEAYHINKDKIANVLVLARIIETKSQEVSLAIAESTNSQTPINGRDLRANDEVQKKLETSFEAMGYFYERKKNQFNDKPRAKRVDAFTAGQALLGYNLEMPEVAKKDRGRVYSDLYETVFSDDVTAEQLLTSLKLLDKIYVEKRKIQSLVRKKATFDSRKLFLVDGALHVLYTVKLLCDKNHKDKWNFRIATKYVNEAIETVASLVESEQATNESFSFNQFFKDSKTKALILSTINSNSPSPKQPLNIGEL